ncbi:MAG: hypothetical protein ACLQHS_14475 [Candidatus Limnocylindrales bacterium]
MAAALLMGGVLVAGVSLLGAVPAAAAGTTLYVDGTNGTFTTGCTSPGTSACLSIQDGVNAAETYTDTDVTVEVAAGTYHENVTITVPSGDTLTLEGAGASTTTANGSSKGSVFSISSGTATIDGFTITNGSAPIGGGIYNWGTVTLTDDTLSDDSATSDGGGGGGVYNGGSATLTDDTFSGDSATLGGGEGGGVFDDLGGTATLTDDTFSDDSATWGGGVFNAGTATLTDDTFSGDSAPSGDGGGVYNYQGTATVTLTDDTLSGDSATSGGGVYNAGTATLFDDTLSGDLATSGGGGGVDNSGTATLTDDTFSNDSATDGGGGVYNYDSDSATISNSILDVAPCGGTISDGYYNVEDDTSCGFGSTDLVSSSTINLATSLAANGSSGPETLAIGTDSSAYEEVPAANCTLTTDERGDPRPGVPGANCDAGAFEYEAPAGTATTAPLSGLSPAAGTSSQAPQLDALSCPATGWCVAVGDYVDVSGNQQGLIETLADGTWTATTAPLSGLSPAAATTPNGYVYLAALSCPAVGSCVAAGLYVDASGYQQGLIETLSGGNWTATTAPLSGLSPAAGTNPTRCTSGPSRAWRSARA